MRYFKYIVLLFVADVLATVAYLALSFVAVQSSASSHPLAILWGDENEMGAETERRIAYAIEVWKSGHRSRLVFCIGGARPARGYFGSVVLTERLVAAGVPREQIKKGSGSNDTISNLSELAGVARTHGVRNVLVVTDRLQAMRIAWFLRVSDGLEIDWSLYSFQHAAPQFGTLELWRRIHYEWVALLSLLMPDSLRRGLIDRFRT